MNHRQPFYTKPGLSRPHDFPLPRPFLPPLERSPVSRSFSSLPTQPSGLRFPARESPSLSPSFDLSQYSMTQERTSPRPQLVPIRLSSPIAAGSRKRDREDDVGSTHSRSSSSIPSIVTPNEHPESPSKRRPSAIDNLLTSDVDIKPVIPSWNDWTRRNHSPTYELSKSNFDMPAPPTQPVAFPIQFPYSPNAANVDPALSSVRSSADQITASPQAAPELRFNDETLHSATSSPGAAVLEAALQHAQAAGIEDQLVNPDVDNLRKDQPFSRSPELRISHKLAERKRRKEMKDLFDELREHLPAERGSKSSKWEILSKAIDNIAQLKRTNATLQSENEALRRELDIARGNSGQSLRQWQQYPNFNGNGPAAELATEEVKE